MKKLILYFTFDGHTEKVAQILAEKINADLEKIVLKNKIPKNFLKYLIGIFWVISKKKILIEPLKNDLNNYEIVLIGAPVWASTYCPVLNPVIDQIKNKKVIVFTTYANFEGNSIKNMINKLKINNGIIAENSFKENEIKLGKIEEKINNWLKTIKF